MRASVTPCQSCEWLTREMQAASAALTGAKNQAYAERNKCVAFMAGMALRCGWDTWLGRHDEADQTWEKDWTNIVFIQLPTGQVSWHIHDSELPLFDLLQRKGTPWDGHTTEEKYERMQRWIAGPPL